MYVWVVSYLESLLSMYTCKHKSVCVGSCVELYLANIYIDMQVEIYEVDFHLLLYVCVQVCSSHMAKANPQICTI